MAQSDKQASDMHIPTAPKGLAILLVVGPSLVWAAEYNGSGEVIIATAGDEPEFSVGELPEPHEVREAISRAQAMRADD